LRIKNILFIYPFYGYANGITTFASEKKLLKRRLPTDEENEIKKRRQ